MSLSSCIAAAPSARRPLAPAPRGQARRTLLCTSALLVSALMLPAPLRAAPALPTGGSVASGAASIATTAGTVTVNQSSARAIINWQGFSVGQGNSVTFNQPNAQSATLNRVTGGATSQIAGQIVSNGAVYLVNPNGIAITSTGSVQTGGGFVASTLDISDADFNAGRLHFAGTGASAAVSNAGRIAAGQGAYVALLGGSVSNGGTISVPVGSVGLGSGEEIGLDLNGDHFMQVAIPTSAIADGKPLIDMAGTIVVTGGRVTLSAASVKEAVRNIVNLSGSISADSAIGNAGSIQLLGGDGGTVIASGTLSARATGATGDGGTVETSGAAVNFTGLRVDTSAAGGKTGTWLVDPTDLTVDAASALVIDANLATSNVSLQAGNTASGPGVTSSGAGDLTIAAPLAWASANTLTLTADHDININAAISAPLGGLTLQAGNPYGALGTIRDTADLSIGTFALNYGDWTQNAATLPGFSATDFRIVNANVGNFLRVTGGDGSAATPYLIADAYGLQGLRGYGLLGLDYALAGDIDARVTATWNGGGGFSPIGDNNAFIGSLDGRGHAINGLTINLDQNEVGLFARLGGTVSNLRLVGGSISGIALGNVHYGAGALASSLSTGGVVTNVTSSVAVSGANNVGGLIGTLDGTITGSSSSGTVTGIASNVGGLVGLLGYNNRGNASIATSFATGAVTDTSGRGDSIGGLVGGSTGQIDQSYATGAVTGTNKVGSVGGLVGSVYGYANGNAPNAGVTRSYATGDVTGSDSDIGGLIGSILTANVSDSYATGKVVETTGTGRGIGGLVGGSDSGQSIANLTNVYATGDVSGALDIGGLIGDAGGTTTIVGAHATGTVQSIAPNGISGGGFGGLVGTLGNSSSVTQSYASGAVTHDQAGNAYGNSVGGLVGIAQGYVTYSYATGDVTGTNDNVGGLIGLSNNGSGVTDTNNYATGNVVGNTLPDAYFNGASIGGLIGGALIDQSFANSYATGSVSAVQHEGGAGANGSTQAGGLIGYIGGGAVNISKSFASGNVSVTGAVSTIDGSGNATNTVSNRVGGLIGYISAGHGVIDQVYASGNVATDGQRSEIGGLIGGWYDGGNHGVLSNAYATGSVTATGAYATNAINDQATNPGGGGSKQTIGGLIGLISGSVSIANTYAAGHVSGRDDIGGLLGYNSLSRGEGGVSSSYWDMQTTGLDTSQAGEGRTTYQLQNINAPGSNVYGGWDFSAIWSLPSGGYYPQLFALTPVIFATAGDATTTYGTAPTALGTYVGGPSDYVFGPANDSLAGFLAGSTSATVSSPVGTYAITPYAGTSFTSTGGVVYRVAAAGSGTLTINPALLTAVSASLVGSASKVYDGTTSAILAPGNFALTGFLNGDGASVNQTVGTYSSANAGTGILVTASLSPDNFTANAGTSLSNYVLPTSASGAIGTITPATLSLLYTANAASRVYGNANPAFGGTLTANGLVGSDTLAAVTSGTAAFASTADARSGVGRYAIAGDGLSLTSGNYVLATAQAAGNATALQITPRTVSVTADDASMIYGAALPALTYAIGGATADGGLVNGDALSGALASGGSAGANVGRYAITQGTLGNPNYSIAFAGGTLTITPATLQILYSATPTTSIYGNAIGALGGTVQASGLVNGDTLAGVTGGSASFSTSATARSDVGRYAVTGSGLVATSGNYSTSFGQAAGNANALTIAPRGLTITADPQQRAILLANPPLTYTVGGLGLANGDQLSGGLATSAGLFSPAGRYPILQGTLTASPNYDLTYIGSDLTVTSPPTQSLSDFLAWLRQVVVRFEPRDKACAAGAIAAKLRDRGFVKIGRSGCDS